MVPRSKTWPSRISLAFGSLSILSLFLVTDGWAVGWDEAPPGPCRLQLFISRDGHWRPYDSYEDPCHLRLAERVLHEQGYATLISPRAHDPLAQAVAIAISADGTVTIAIAESRGPETRAHALAIEGATSVSRAYALRTSIGSSAPLFGTVISP